MTAPVDPSSPRAATPRAILMGLSLAVVVNILSVSTSYLVGFTHLTFAHIDLGLLIPFFLGVLGPNILVKAIHPAWGLRNKELLFVFVLGLDRFHGAHLRHVELPGRHDGYGGILRHAREPVA